MVLLASQVWGQKQSDNTKTEAIELVNQLTHELTENYLYDDVAKKIELSLSQYQTFLQTSPEISAPAFIDSVNSILFEHSHDHHLKFYHDPEKFEIFSSGEDAVIDSLEREQYRRINFGVRKVEILASNIGLLTLNKFQQFEDVRQVITGAMMMLANSDAIIIDLRYNGGGDGRTSQFIQSFFLTEERFFENENRMFERNVFNEFKNEFPSSCKRLEKVPLYILTGLGTFSASEGFTLDLQKRNRATIVGTQTKGGGNSGGSVALSYGYLVFVPTGSTGSEIEGKGITPDFVIDESKALLDAKKRILDSFVSTCSDSTLLQQHIWNRETCTALLSNGSMDLKQLASNVGEYTKGFTISIIGEDLILTKPNGKSSKLRPINESYFIAADFTDFGEGNDRVEFINESTIKLRINLGVKLAELELTKNN
jgi:hypothetical protein